ncbi:Conserved_hypothetical protein [Hexamita inflata]|uniref:Uncharacterized protein n=1 Tax=Hexamita inflata TaxID=28002 RepID=A0AA86R030_9EUKA|nr:Conserved hypothetical protein [Hexamita inflata]
MSRIAEVKNLIKAGKQDEAKKLLAQLKDPQVTTELNQVQSDLIGFLEKDKNNTTQKLSAYVQENMMLKQQLQNQKSADKVLRLIEYFSSTIQIDQIQTMLRMMKESIVQQEDFSKEIQKQVVTEIYSLQSDQNVKNANQQLEIQQKQHNDTLQLLQRAKQEINQLQQQQKLDNTLIQDLTKQLQSAHSEVQKHVREVFTLKNQVKELQQDNLESKFAQSPNSQNQSAPANSLRRQNAATSLIPQQHQQNLDQEELDEIIQQRVDEAYEEVQQFFNDFIGDQWDGIQASKESIHNLKIVYSEFTETHSEHLETIEDAIKKLIRSNGKQKKTPVLEPVMDLRTSQSSQELNRKQMELEQIIKQLEDVQGENEALKNELILMESENKHLHEQLSKDQNNNSQLEEIANLKQKITLLESQNQMGSLPLQSGKQEKTQDDKDETILQLTKKQEELLNKIQELDRTIGDIRYNDHVYIQNLKKEAEEKLKTVSQQCQDEILKQKEEVENKTKSMLDELKSAEQKLIQSEQIKEKSGKELNDKNKEILLLLQKIKELENNSNKQQQCTLDKNQIQAITQEFAQIKLKLQQTKSNQSLQLINFKNQQQTHYENLNQTLSSFTLKMNQKQNNNNNNTVHLKQQEELQEIKQNFLLDNSEASFISFHSTRHLPLFDAFLHYKELETIRLNIIKHLKVSKVLSKDFYFQTLRVFGIFNQVFNSDQIITDFSLPKIQGENKSKILKNFVRHSYNRAMEIYFEDIINQNVKNIKDIYLTYTAEHDEQFFSLLSAIMFFVVDGFEVGSGAKVQKNKTMVFPLLQREGVIINALQVNDDELVQ